MSFLSLEAPGKRNFKEENQKHPLSVLLPSILCCGNAGHWPPHPALSSSCPTDLWFPGLHLKLSSQKADECGRNM